MCVRAELADLPEVRQGETLLTHQLALCALGTVLVIMYLAILVEFRGKPFSPCNADQQACTLDHCLLG